MLGRGVSFPSLVISLTADCSSACAAVPDGVAERSSIAAMILPDTPADFS
jgi:hypothetical protein